MRAKWVSVGMVILSFGVLFYSACEILSRKFSTGSVYSAYSSYLSEPIGSSALKETLQAAGRNVEILNRPFDRSAAPPEKTVLFYLSPGIWGRGSADPQEMRNLKDFVLSGGRVFVATGGQDALLREFNIYTRWIYRADTEFLLTCAAPVGSMKSYPGAGPLQVTRNWWLDSRWPQSTVLLAADTYPVMIRAEMGRGDIIVCSDPYILSNEGLFVVRASWLLSWIVRDRSTILIDETHHGVLDREGVTSLFGKYHLEPFIIFLTILLFLSLWMIVPAFMPAIPRLDDSIHIQDTFEGIVNLLGQTVARRDVLRVCYERWSTTEKLNIDSATRSAVENEIWGGPDVDARSTSADSREVCAAYNRIQKILEETKRHVI